MAKQGVSIFKTYRSNTNEPLFKPHSYEISVPKTLVEIYNEPIFFNTKSNGVNNHSMFFKKTPLARVKDLFVTKKDLCTVTRPSFITLV